MTYFQAYLLTRLDNFNHFFGSLSFLIFLLIVAALMVIIFSAINLNGIHSEESKPFWVNLQKKAFGYIKIFVVTIFFFQTAKALLPTTKEVAFIYIAPAIVNNQDIRKTLKKIPELSGLGLEYLGDILKNEIKEGNKEAVSQVKMKLKTKLNNR